MKSKSVDLEINEANDRDSNSHVNLITKSSYIMIGLICLKE